MYGKRPYIIICLTTYNSKPALTKVLNALLNLKYPKNKLSLVIVDDYSYDGTWEELLEFQQKYNNVFNIIILRRFYSRNVAKARNRCLETAFKECPYGEFIFILDHDIVPPPNSLEILLNHMRHDPKLGSAHGLRISNQDNIIENLWRAIWPRPYGYVEWADVDCTLIRTEAIKRTGLFNENMTRWENREYVARLRKNGYRVLIDSRVKCLHLSISRQTEQTMGHPKGLIDFIKSIFLYYFRVLPANIDYIIKVETKWYRTRFFFYMLLPYVTIAFFILKISVINILMMLVPIIYHSLRLRTHLKVKIFGAIILILQKVLVAQGYLFYKITNIFKLLRSRISSNE